MKLLIVSWCFLRKRRESQENPDQQTEMGQLCWALEGWIEEFKGHPKNSRGMGNHRLDCFILEPCDLIPVSPGHVSKCFSYSSSFVSVQVWKNANPLESALVSVISENQSQGTWHIDPHCESGTLWTGCRCRATVHLPALLRQLCMFTPKIPPRLGCLPSKNNELLGCVSVGLESSIVHF